MHGYSFDIYLQLALEKIHEITKKIFDINLLNHCLWQLAIDGAVLLMKRHKRIIAPVEVKELFDLENKAFV